MSQRRRPKGYTGPDLSKSLNELPGEHLGAPPAGATGLVIRCHRLHDVPVKDLTPGDLRVLVSQQFGLVHLVPLAVDLLASDALLDSQYYPGDLLIAVLRVVPDFWREHPDLRRRVDAILERAGKLPQSVMDPLKSFREQT